MAIHSSTHRGSRERPSTRLGRGAVTLAGLCVAGVVLLLIGFALNLVEPAQSYTDSWPQLVWGIGIWGCGIGAVIVGGIAIVRQHERSWMVLLATAVGLLPLALLVWEIASGNF